MVITLYQSKYVDQTRSLLNLASTKLSPHYYCELPTGRETSFLIGCVACENGVWYIDMVKFSAKLRLPSQGFEIRNRPFCVGSFNPYSTPNFEIHSLQTSVLAQHFEARTRDHYQPQYYPFAV